MEIKTIIDSWIEYIETEEFEGFKISIGNPHCHLIETSQINQITKDNETFLIISKLDEKLKKFLEKIFPLEKENNEEDKKMYFVFPVFKYSVKNNKNNKIKEYYQGLFALEIIENFFNRENCSLEISLDISGIFKPLLGVLNRFSSLSHTETDVIKELFPENATTLQQLSNFIEYSDKKIKFDKNNFISCVSNLKDIFRNFNKNKKSVGLLNNQFIGLITSDVEPEDYNRNLKKELNLLKDIDINNDPLLKKYLFEINSEKITEPVLKELNVSKYWLGFHNKDGENIFPLSKGQAIVLQELEKENNLISVQGAPGTGKTTLLLSIIANRIVHRAVSIINNEDFNNWMLVTSHTNKAVDNVIERLSKEFKDINWFYFLGGKKDNIDNNRHRIEDFIQEIEKSDFNQDEYNNLKGKIVAIVTFFEKEFEKYKLIKEFKKCKGLIENIKNIFNIDPEEKNYLEIINNEKKFFDFKNFLKKKINFNSIEEIFNFPALEMLRDLEESEKKLEKVGFFKKLFSKNKEEEKILKFFIAKYEYEFEKVKENNFSSIEELKVFFESIKERLEFIKKYSPGLHINDENYSEYVEKIRKYFSLKSRFKDFSQEDFDKYGDNFGEYFRVNLIKKNQELFLLSVKFIYSHIIKNKQNVITALKKWLETLLSNKRITDFENFFEKSLPFISLAYPVVTSTLTSISNILRTDIKSFLAKKPFHLILSDESGMIHIHTLAPILLRGEKAIVVGDPKQLEPVVSVTDNEENNLFKEFYNNDTLFTQFSPTKTTAYHRAANSFTSDYDDIGNGILLDEHRRCLYDIADAFIKIADYKGLNVKTPPLTENIEFFEKLGSKSLIFYDTVGKRARHRNTNSNEGDIIASLLGRLEKIGVNVKKDVGIITPYKNQEDYLIKRFGKNLGHKYNEEKIGTVHKFQGKEFEIIIFSPVISFPNDSASFINKKPNLLNVAISRAKKIFITVGNFKKLIKSGGYLAQLAKIFDEKGLIIPSDNIKFSTNVYDKYNPEIISDTCRHVDVFKNAIGDYAKKEVIIISPWIRNFEKDAVKNFQFNIIKSAVKRNVNVKIFYGYGKNRDEDKNSCDMDLVRNYERLLGKNFIRIPRGTHEKVLIIDREYLIIGSFNWLSHKYHVYCSRNKNFQNSLIRRETSVIIKNKSEINRYLSELSLL